MMPLISVVTALLLPEPRPGLRLPQSTAETAGTARRTGVARRLLPALPAAVGLATLAFLVIGRVGILIAVALAGATGTYLLHAHHRRRHARAIEEATERLLTAVIDEAEAGALLPAAVASAAKEATASPSAVRDAFAAAAAYAHRGGAGYDILRGSEEDAVRQVGHLWALSDSLGLPAAQLLHTARSRLRASLRRQSQVRAALQGPQFSGLVLAALPVGGLALGTSMGADSLNVLLRDGPSSVLLIVGVALDCAGLLACHALVRRAGG
ncbi:hypothetical protein [Corynebacterium uterequi]|uniref:Flp pilus assembly protein TadB n=1 Tax=Corynebacterium uterequi TaxID=1072256 RepID=A0A0G3HBY7_9CORY|nr:hypothetical protein [Corynebacterium uterequi]AKK10200.1 hypothetical protein CUTER_00895 [Corynebacterium uterequi]